MTLPFWGSGPSAFFRWFTGYEPHFGLVTSGTGWRGGCPSQSLVLVMGCLRLRPGSPLALDIEEVLSGVGGDQLHVMVADAEHG